MKSYVVVGKFSQIKFEEIFSKQITKKVELNLTYNDIEHYFSKDVAVKMKSFLEDKTLIRGLIAAGVGILIAALLQNVGFAADNVHDAFANHSGGAIEVMALPNGTGYKEPTQLHAILSFIDWLIFLTRWIVSSIIGLIATFAGYRWATDISGNGVAEAKKMLKNCAIGIFWVQFGATIANYFVSKISSFL